MKVKAVVECPVGESFRVSQVRGMFDLAVGKKAREVFEVEVPGEEEEWSVGVIVGPSGSGKSTVAREAFGEAMFSGAEWGAGGEGGEGKAVVDCFPEGMGIREVTQLLSSVGFSSPPGWVKPWAVLSNGEKFRCDLARALAGPESVVVFDEFTSVVDRTVAKVGSAAVSKAIRAGRVGAPAGAEAEGKRKRFVAVSCHYDIVEWLEPDWVVDMAGRTLARGLLRRPGIRMEVIRADRSAWELFRRHHYLDTTLHPAAGCYVGLVEGEPAAFVAAMHFPHPVRCAWREHRCVCLPDFQGLGIGNRLSEFVAGVYRVTGKVYRSTTSHPAMMRYRARSRLWRMVREPGRVGRHKGETGMKGGGSGGRMTASFEYVGPVRLEEARGFGVV